MAQRHWCRACGTWTQGDAQSVRRHEAGGRHKASARRASRDAARAKASAARENARIAAELARVDRAAREASGAGGPPPPPRLPSLQPPPPPALEEQLGEEEEEDLPPWQVLDGQVLGQYGVDGTTYLEGVLHEDLLTPGRAVEVVVVETGEDGEPEEVWRRGTVRGVSWATVGRRSEARYAVLLEGGERLEAGERQAPPADVRIAAPPPPPGVPVSALPAAQQRLWRAGTLAAQDEKDRAHEDALATFNPYGGSYKGFKIDMAKTTAEQVAENMAAATAAETTAAAAATTGEAAAAGPRAVMFKKRRRKAA